MAKRLWYTAFTTKIIVAMISKIDRSRFVVIIVNFASKRQKLLEPKLEIIYKHVHLLTH